SREAGPISFTTGPAFMHLKTGDCVYLDVPSEDFPMQPVIITGVGLDPSSGKVGFTAETETASKHPFALGQTSVPPQPFDIETPLDQPPPDGWTAEAISEAGQVGIKITGTTDETLATGILLRL